MKQIALIILLIIVISPAYSPTAQQFRIADTKVHTVNNVRFTVSNYGAFGTNRPYGPGCYWPINTDHNYIWGAGIWFGTSIGGDTLVTLGYDPRYGTNEFVPGIAGMDASDPQARIFIYPETWPPNAIYSTAPQEIISNQDSWCAFNDLDSSAHVPGDTRPIGIEVYQSVYAWDLEIIRDVVFLKYEIKNASNIDLSGCYFGICADNDIGSESGYNANDIISGIVGRWYLIDNKYKYADNIGYQWQEEIEPSWNEYPGLIGFDLLQSPWDLVENHDKDYDDILDQHERDSSYYVNNLPSTKWDIDFDLLPDWRDPSEIPQKGMTAFKSFVFTYEARNDYERYVSMQGYNFKTGAYQPFDTIPSYPGDHRFLISTGPFDLCRDSIMTFVFAIMFCNWHDIYQTPDTALVNIDHTTQYIFDMNWLLPGPPSAPNLTCIPGDASITLIWENSPENQPDDYYELVGNPQSPYYDPYYRQYDFEGYRVYRSLTGQSGDWDPLSVCDRANGIQFAFPTPENAEDTIYATDAGLFHSYTDNTVRNGFTYYYAVSSFDNNSVKSTYDSIFVVDSVWYAPESIWLYVYDTLEVTGPRELIFESGKIGITAVPRRDPANYVAGSFAITQDYGNPLLADSNVGVMITYPLDMTADPFYLDFSKIAYDSALMLPRYQVYLRDVSDSTLETFSAVLGVGAETRQEFIAYNGLSMAVVLARPSIPTTISIFDRIEQVSGTYPVDSLVNPVIMGTNWAYRGNDYQLTWIDAYSSGWANSIVVVDMQSGDTILFKPYRENAATDSLADSWCFRSLQQSTDTLVYGTTPTGTRNIYINGGKFRITQNYMSPGDEPRPAIGEVWTAYAQINHPAPQGARLTVTPTPATLRTDTTFTLNVKVVPNPYLVHNEWQQTFSQRRIRFINLPSECTIRVFTLNGDLVRTIRHHHTLEVGENEIPITNSAGGDEWWNLLSETNHLLTSGIYIFHVQSDVGEQVGKFVIIR